MVSSDLCVTWPRTLLKGQTKVWILFADEKKIEEVGPRVSVLSYKTNYVLVWCIYLFFYFYNNLCWFIYLSGLTILQQKYLTDLHTVFCKMTSAHLGGKILENFNFFSKDGGVGYYYLCAPPPFFI